MGSFLMLAMSDSIEKAAKIYKMELPVSDWTLHNQLKKSGFTVYP